jgi:hypothetical protein
MNKIHSPLPAASLLARTTSDALHHEATAMNKIHSPLLARTMSKWRSHFITPAD